jgi:hypothetical protein
MSTLAGTTSSTNFPTQGPAFPGNKGLSDIFVTKFDGVTGNILYSTYIGGSGVDRADSIATDSNGNAYVVGRVRFHVKRLSGNPWFFRAWLIVAEILTAWSSNSTRREMD